MAFGYRQHIDVICYMPPVTFGVCQAMGGGGGKKRGSAGAREAAVLCRLGYLWEEGKSLVRDQAREPCARVHVFS